jgi:hypothetical protein
MFITVHDSCQPRKHGESVKSIVKDMSGYRPDAMLFTSRFLFCFPVFSSFFFSKYKGKSTTKPIFFSE